VFVGSIRFSYAKIGLGGIDRYILFYLIPKIIVIDYFLTVQFSLAVINAEREIEEHPEKRNENG
jgi:hypothetical protein